jgi:hypothetical protein
MNLNTISLRALVGKANKHYTVWGAGGIGARDNIADYTIRGGGPNNYQQPLPTHTHAHPSLGPTNVIQMRTRNSSFVDFKFFLVSFGGWET